MFRRALASALAALHGANGVFMLLAPVAWLSFVTGRTIAGPPPGVHFLFDVGWAFIASAIGFLVFALRPQQWAAAAIGGAFPLLHAGMHVAEILQGHAFRLGFELVAIVAPALLGIMVLWPAQSRYKGA